SGCAGMDLATAHTVTLLDSTVHLLPTTSDSANLGKQSALIVGRSSTTLTGLFVLPGVVDADAVGNIAIMAWTPSPPCTIPAGSRIAQLVPFLGPQKDPATAELLPVRTGNFGSTGTPSIYWAQNISHQRPTCRAILIQSEQRYPLQGILDTGADVTVIS
ncbi:POK9 protein, partial [Nycticryphes semicollaris]|nr:POK9 protein [Nycticryphes semicollaris]